MLRQRRGWERLGRLARNTGAGEASLVADQKARELRERLLIDVAFELDHCLERHPVLTPAPGIELGFGARAERNVAVAADEAQQEPDLLLPAVAPPPLALDPLRGDLVAQPASRPAEDLHVVRQQTDFLAQLPVHCLLGGLAMLDPALRELPGVLVNALAPENLVPLIAEDDADVRAVAVPVEHDRLRGIGCLAAFFHKTPGLQSALGRAAAWLIKTSVR